MADDPSFADLMDRLRGGDGGAAEQVFGRFAARLVRLASSRLTRALRAKADEEDVVQSVFRTFFRRQAGGEFEVADWDGLWSLLVVIAVRKCGMHARRFRTAARDVRRERPAGGPADGGVEALRSAVAREPTPDEAAVLAETVEGLLDGLAGDEREIVALALQGCEAADISGRVGRTERTVYRVLARLRQRLEGTLPPAGDAD